MAEWRREGVDYEVPLPKEIDLSFGSLSKQKLQSLDLNAQEWAQRRSQQRWLFLLGVAIVLALYGTAIYFAVTTFDLAARRWGVDWHAWLVSVSFLLPPTIVFITLTRAVYVNNQKDRDAAQEQSALLDVPAVGITKDFIVDAVKEGLK